MDWFFIPSRNSKHLLISSNLINSSTLCACSIEPGPQTAVLIPISWNKPASVPNETTSLELSPVILDINSQASEFFTLSKPIISTIISLLID